MSKKGQSVKVSAPHFQYIALNVSSSEIPNRQKYFINLEDKLHQCFSCDNPVKEPEVTIPLDTELNINEEGKIDPAQAV